MSGELDGEGGREGRSKEEREGGRETHLGAFIKALLEFGLADLDHGACLYSIRNVYYLSFAFLPSLLPSLPPPLPPSLPPSLTGQDLVLLVEVHGHRTQHTRGRRRESQAL